MNQAKAPKDAVLVLITGPAILLQDTAEHVTGPTTSLEKSQIMEESEIPQPEHDCRIQNTEARRVDTHVEQRSSESARPPETTYICSRGIGLLGLKADLTRAPRALKLRFGL